MDYSSIQKNEKKLMKDLKLIADYLGYSNVEYLDYETIEHLGYDSIEQMIKSVKREIKIKNILDEND